MQLRRLAVAFVTVGTLLSVTACGTSSPSAVTTPPPTASSPGTASSSTASSGTPPSTATTPPTGSASGNPFAERSPYAWPGSSAGLAAQNVGGDAGRLVARIAATPTAIWLTPEHEPVGQVGAFVHSIVAAAGAAVPVFVVYGITDRDCATGQSSGGLPPGRYLAWVRAIAGNAGTGSVVILEPDGLASAPACGNVATREHLLARAVQILGSGPTVYLDAGHAQWIPAAQMAQMLQRAGVDHVRGFSLNVSAYDSTASEVQYADQIRQLLPQAHYVIDTGRNGNGGVGGGGQWCNAPGQALGHQPSVGDQPGLDAYLWIKPPGESDGSCNGAPPAGQFWVAGAVTLARNAGW